MNIEYEKKTILYFLAYRYVFTIRFNYTPCLALRAGQGNIFFYGP